MADLKDTHDIEALKKKFASGAAGMEKTLNELPREVVFELVKDPEVGPKVSEAINRSMRSGAAQSPASQQEPENQQPAPANKPDAPRSGMSAAATAIKARREKEEREQKDEQEKRLSVLAQIARMDVGEKAKLARNGDKEARSILIKEGNKLIALAVLANPKITTQEIEMIAASRNVSEEVLREIANNKDWVKGYTVMLSLVNNPKTPIGLTLTYLPRLMTRDLRSLAKSKGVPEVIRVSARKMAQKRSI